MPQFGMPALDLTVVVCRTCGLGTLVPQPSADQIAAYYPHEYYGSGGRKFVGIVERLTRFVGARHTRFLAQRLKHGARVLDVGCGRGITLNALAQAGFEVHGFEVVRHAVEGIDRRIHVKIAASLVEAAYPDEFFDEVVLWHVLEHVPDPRTIVREVHRILRPSGMLVVAVPNFSSLQARVSGATWFHLDLPRHLYHFHIEALRRLIGELGFTCHSEHHFSLRQNPFGWVQSALNALRWLPRNGLYVLLNHRSSGQPAPFSPIVRIQLWAAFWLMMPPALLLSVLAALLRRGATVHLVAFRE